jgi:hypothetical protein
MRTGFSWGKLKDEPGAQGMIILKWMLKTQDGTAWIRVNLAQDRDKWRAIANIVMNIPVPYRQRIY